MTYGNIKSSIWTTGMMSKDLWEEEAIERFRSYLGQARSCSFIITGRDVIVDPISRENFDYKLTSSTGQMLAVEIVRLVESKEELVSSKIWSQIVDELKKELIKRGISGYVISLPLHLNIPRREIHQYVNQAADIINQSIVTHQGIDQFSSNQMTFYRIPNYEGVSFASTPEARSINPHGTAASALLVKLEKKNRQLSIQEHERILLVVNWTIIVDETDMVRALTTIPFEAYPNIDTIYFETRPSQFSYVYDRAAYSSILNNDHTGSPHPELLSHYLKYRLADGKRDAYTFVRTRTECLGSITWLNDELARQNLITYVVDGEETTEEEQLWVIRTLCADPDPDPEGKIA
jgi:hypothetical protein